MNDSIECRAIGDADVERLVALDREYLGAGPRRLAQWRRRHPSWCRGAHAGGELVGVCYGYARSPSHVVLEGIAVVVERWRQGIGSTLLRDFEDVVFADGAAAISVGSAADAKTEGFYLKNRYRPVRIMLRHPTRSVAPSSDPPLPDAVQVVSDEAGVRRYYAVDGYVPEVRDSLRTALEADEGIFIFEKQRERAR